MKDRVSGFEQKLAEGRTDQHIRAVEKSGQTLMQSMADVHERPWVRYPGQDRRGGQHRAWRHPHAVMSEMQPGGRYASLRSEFDNALQQERAFAASFSAVEKAAAHYGHDRLTLGADFQARKMDASATGGPFRSRGCRHSGSGREDSGALAGSVRNGRDGGKGGGTAQQGGRPGSPNLLAGAGGRSKTRLLAQHGPLT